MNKIKIIGTRLDGLDSLEDLEMSGNIIENFKELLNLNRLPKLERVTFLDPYYGDNTICNVWYYQIYVLYHHPQLENLILYTLMMMQKHLLMLQLWSKECTIIWE